MLQKSRKYQLDRFILIVLEVFITHVCTKSVSKILISYLQLFCEQVLNHCLLKSLKTQKLQINVEDKYEWYIKWQRVVQRVTTNDNEWYNESQQEIISGNSSSFFFRIREGSTTKHPKANSLNLKEDLEEKRDIELRAEGSP